MKDYIVVAVKGGRIVKQFDTPEEAIAFAKNYNEVVEVQSYDEITETYSTIFLGGKNERI